MCIYQPTPITQKMIDRFQPTRLYIKELAGIKYFGKTSKEDIMVYAGSGVVWGKRIKKYGKDNIKTLWVSDWYHDPYEIQKVALHFSEENSIVESDVWANQKPEDGLDGGRQSPEVQVKITNKITGQKRSPEQNEAKSKRQTGTKKSQKWLNNRPGYDKTIYDWLHVGSGFILSMGRRDFTKQYIMPHTQYHKQTVQEMKGDPRKIKFGWQLLGPSE